MVQIKKIKHIVLWYRYALNPDNPLGTIQCDFIVSVRPELAEGLVLTGLVVRRAHHERPNGLSGLNLNNPIGGGLLPHLTDALPANGHL